VLIGLDFDNTIVGYDHIFQAEAVKRGWIDAADSRNKKNIRDAIRLLDSGERKWMELQAEVYGPLMKKAKLMPGVAEFMQAARRRDVPVVIVSHKSQFAAAAPDGHDLRQAALDWMLGHGFFSAGGFALEESDVHFAATRAEKCAKIRELCCTHFIDDLEEVLRDPDFPENVAAYLYHPSLDDVEEGPYKVVRDWESFCDACFGKSDRDSAVA